MTEKAQTTEQVSIRPSRQAQSTLRQAPEGPIASPWNLQQALLDPTRTPARAVLALQRKVGNRELSNLLTKVRRDIASSQQASASTELESGSAGQAFTDSPLAIAARGLSGPSEPLPFYRAIQQAFGRHDLSHVQAHQGPAARTAARALGATAFAMGEKLAFQERPDLFTAAHEAAHVIQQRGGNVPAGGVGKEHDRYEQQADQVASAVVRGQNVEGLLGPVLSTRGSPAALQFQKMKELFAKELHAWKPEWKHNDVLHWGRTSTLEELHAKLDDEHDIGQSLLTGVSTLTKKWTHDHNKDTGDRHTEKETWVNGVETKARFMSFACEIPSENQFLPGLALTQNQIESALPGLPSDDGRKFVFLNAEYFDERVRGFYHRSSGSILINTTAMINDDGTLKMHSDGQNATNIPQLTWTVAHESGHRFDYAKNLMGNGYLNFANWMKVEEMNIDRLIVECKRNTNASEEDLQATFVLNVKRVFPCGSESDQDLVLRAFWDSDRVRNHQASKLELDLYSWLAYRKNYYSLPDQYCSTKILTEDYREWWLYSKGYRQRHKVSDYSFAHPREWFAEAFACYMVDENRLKNIDVQAHDFIEHQILLDLR